MKTDTQLQRDVIDELRWEPRVKEAEIAVSAHDGVVTLTGSVETFAQKYEAIDLAKATKGVTRVVDMISTKTASGSGHAPEPTRTIGETITDAGITVSVKTQLLDDPLVKGLQIDVDPRDGVVYLTGSVASDAERQGAIRLAKETKGVRDVQANLTLQKS